MWTNVRIIRATGWIYKGEHIKSRDFHESAGLRATRTGTLIRDRTGHGECPFVLTAGQVCGFSSASAEVHYGDAYPPGAS